MSGFLPVWLTLREPVDHSARSEAVLSAVAHYFLEENYLQITDIGTGTGSTVRALRPFLSHNISWHLIDNDSLLLEHAQKALGEQNVQLSNADLSTSLDAIFAAPASLVTTSAFLDLVSEAWMQNFAAKLAQHKIPFYAALTYNGISECLPHHDLDEVVLDAFNTHQKTDKGFGPAMGPDAADISIRILKEHGFEIIEDRSDWIAGPNHPQFQQILLEGWHQAACEIKPDLKSDFDQWLEFRIEKIKNNENHVTVGHVDFIAIPPED